MQAFGIIGPGAEDAAARIADRLGDDGRVGRIRSAAADGGAELDRSSDPHTTYTIGEDGWTAKGSDGSPEALLRRLAPEHDYAIVTGFQSSSLPSVVLGDADHDGPTIHEAANATEVDLEAIAEAVEELEPLETLSSLVAEVKRSPAAERAGAIGTFTGQVRAKDGPDDEPTTHLEFEKYEGIADERMAGIREDLEARDGVLEVRLHHKTGVIEAGEDIVFVVVLAGHRQEAFRAVEDGINRLKDEVPIFKKEVTVEDEFWVHQRS